MIFTPIFTLWAALRSIVDYEDLFSPVDSVIVLGDLLTYGVHPKETIALLHELSLSRPTLFVLGNHDQMYIDFLSYNSSNYYNNLPDWIKESVDFNLSKLDPGMFLNFNFSPHNVFNDLLASHANFNCLTTAGFDWSYVNNSAEHLHQLRILSAFGSCVGVIGHTHRSRCYSIESALPDPFSLTVTNRPVQLDSPIDLSRYSFSLLNAGSIGQPRDRTQSLPSWLLVEFEDLIATVATYISFEYDSHAHVADIAASRLSVFCKEKLRSFYPAIQ